jgi:hypothetical protein
MHLQRWALIAVLALGFAGELRAQNIQNLSSATAPSAFTGISPSNVQFKAVDLSGASSSGTSILGSSQNQFSLSSFFRRFSIFSAPTFGQSNIPAPSFANPVMPSMPINSTVGSGNILIPQFSNPVTPALPINR